ncbi:MAG: sulfur globule protein precursor [Rhizobiales bacterium]|nr:sulfur globule protein precursor [Hyphomicrobiales bacterium]
MMKKFALAFAAVAALGLATLAPSTASAGGHHGFHHHGFRGHFHHGFHGGPRVFIGGPVYAGGYGCTVRRLVPTPYGLRWRWVNRCY